MTTPVKRKNIESKKRSDDSKPTIPDLVILSLLAERPMHGYEVNATLEERRIREWAPVSRPQIYYSLDKLTRMDLIRIASDDAPATGPERRVFETTKIGKDKLADALDSDHWISARVYQPFLIWLALSWQARSRTFLAQLNSRRKFLAERLAAERAALNDVRAEVGHEHHEAVWMLELKSEQTRLEIRWIDKIIANASKREHARNSKNRST
ncbi:MAG TPA: PadR family transcriptional regulator [Pyrinomonadaceae bacterium]|jgi:DNA-binding PadR family transcriptional regulator